MLAEILCTVTCRGSSIEGCKFEFQHMGARKRLMPKVSNCLGHSNEVEGRWKGAYGSSIRIWVLLLAGCSQDGVDDSTRPEKRLQECD